jgi:hypothetical protein
MSPSLIPNLVPGVKKRRIGIHNTGFHIFVQEVGLLVSFYTDRLKDHHSVLPPTLRGLACLARTHSLDTSQLETLLDR